MDETRDQRTMRASDADRERVADVLRSAASDGRLSLTELEERIDALYAAKTYADFEPVVRDLPGDLPFPPAARAPARVPSPAPLAAPTGRVGGKAGSSAARAVFGGVVRRGDWVVPRRYGVKVVFGGAELDLREATLEEHDVRITVKAVFGGVNIVVPDDVRVVVDGDGIFGAFNDDASMRQPGHGAPTVHVGGRAVFGGVNVQRKSMGEA